MKNLETPGKTGRVGRYGLVVGLLQIETAAHVCDGPLLAVYLYCMYGGWGGGGSP